MCRQLGLVLSVLVVGQAFAVAVARELRIEMEGKVEVNGQICVVESAGRLDLRSGAYVLDGVAPSGNRATARTNLLLSFIPRCALAFLRGAEKDSLLDRAESAVTVEVEGRRKVENISRFRARIHIARTTDHVSVQYKGQIITPLVQRDRPIEPDGEAVIRLGVNPENGTFVGGARINYEFAKPDPANLGTADFWNIHGTFKGSRAPVVSGYVHVDHCGGNPAEGVAKGTILSFPSTTVFEPGVITFDGVARKDGVIHQFKGIANQTGGGRTVLLFPVRIKKGMTASQVAAQVAKGFKEARLNPENDTAPYILAVQGGDGVRKVTTNRDSPRVVVSMTFDNGRTVGSKLDPRANLVSSQVGTQSFSDQQVLAAENTGIRTQFGVLGEPPLTGWLTPFKLVLATDNPATDFKAAGGEVAVRLNWSESLPKRRQLPGSTTSFEDIVVKTKQGESAEDIIIKISKSLRQLRTKWETHPFFQRQGNVLYIDAGIDFPHTVSVISRDEGVGYMSAAADLPAFDNVAK